DHVFELFQPLGGYRHVISSLLSTCHSARSWCSGRLGPAALTKKRATSGPVQFRMTTYGDGFGTAESPNCPQITLFSSRCDPASVQVCYDRPRKTAENRQASPGSRARIPTRLSHCSLLASIPPLWKGREEAAGGR